MDMRPVKHRFSMGKFNSSVLNWNPLEKVLGKFRKQNPGEKDEGSSSHPVVCPATTHPNTLNVSPHKRPF